MAAISKTRSSELNKHQIKTEATLRDLLDAAESVFVREGFEKAQIENIAAEMGRTRGSVYAHFKNKEDLFMALVERRARTHIDFIKQSIAGLSPQLQRAWLRDAFADCVTDDNWYILILEFKLFALRNKTSKARVKALYKLVSDDIAQIFKVAGTGRKKSVDFATAIIRGIPSALVIERQFQPILQDDDAVRSALMDIFDALFPA